MKSEISEAALDYNIERVKQEAMMGIYLTMEREGVSRAELARRLGLSPRGRSFVTKILSGSHNFGLETLANVYAALGKAIHFWFDENLFGLEIPEDRSTKSAVLLSASAPIHRYEARSTDASKVMVG